MGNINFDVLAIIAVLNAPALAMAQEAPEERGHLEEVVVTAQKREQNLQDVGTSISVLDAAALEKLGLTNATDIVQQVPALHYNAYSPTITVFNIRGVSQNDFADHQEAPVAVYSDEVYIASMGAIAGNMYDLARVEVLRGPQGTLFGRNATGGLIHYISQKPVFDSEGFVRVTASRFNTIETEAAINTPLNDSSALRFSFATDHSDGFMDNRIGLDSQNANNYAARLQYLTNVGDSGEVLVKLYGVRNINERIQQYSWLSAKPNSNGLGVELPATENFWGTCPGCGLGGYRNPSTDPFNQASSRVGVFDREIYGGTVRVNWQLGDDVELTSVTDYQQMDKIYNDPTEASPTPIFIMYKTSQDYQQVSQELRLSGTQESRHWIAGLYFLDIDSDHETSVEFLPAFGGFVGNEFGVTTQSWAAFGQFEQEFGERWTAILGLRYTEDQRTDRIEYFSPTRSDVIYTYNKSVHPDADRTFHLPSGKFELDYRITDDVMAYASFNRGVKSGGWAQPSLPTDPTGVPIDPNLLAHKSEKLTSYETGVKSTLWDGRARLNASVFYYDYQDYQLFLQEGLLQFIGNRDARVKGGEVEVTFVPADGWDLQLGVSGLDSVVKNVVLPSGAVADRTLPQAPKWSAQALARYEWAAFGGTLSAQADIKWDDDYYFAAFNAPIDLEPAHSVANARVEYRSGDEKWTFAAFVRNLADEEYRVYDLDISALGFAAAAYAPPRWWGVTGSYRW